MLPFQPPLNHWDTPQAISKDNAVPQSDCTVSHKCTPLACICSSSRWCVCEVKGLKMWFFMHGCIHEHVLSSVRLCECVVPLQHGYNKVLSCIIYTFTFKSKHHISLPHALLIEVMFVGFSRVHFEVAVYGECALV